MDMPSLPCMLSKNPDTRVSSTSEMEPIYSCEINEMQPLGVQPIKNFAVLWCL